MDQNKIWSTTRLNTRPIIISSIYQRLTKAVEHKALPILFADDTSILLTSLNNIQMQRDLNEIFMQLNKWFKSNLLSLNFDITSFIHDSY